MLDGFKCPGNCTVSSIDSIITLLNFKRMQAGMSSIKRFKKKTCAFHFLKIVNVKSGGYCIRLTQFLSFFCDFGTFNPTHAHYNESTHSGTQSLKGVVR